MPMMVKDGVIAKAHKDQVPALEADGWSIATAEDLANPVEAEAEPEDSDDDSEDDSEEDGE